jgi:hypothetical protein
VHAKGRTVGFADGSELDVDAVIWATGYRPDHSWIRLPVHDESGRLQHRRGVSAVSGLYFVGLSWQHTRGSALIGFVTDDAQFIAAQVAANAGHGGIAQDNEPATAAARGRNLDEARPRHQRPHVRQPPSRLPRGPKRGRPRDDRGIEREDDMVDVNRLTTPANPVNELDSDYPMQQRFPGRWMAHCHIAEPHESGILFSFDVEPAQI